ncbi:MAG: hypothetical protein K0M50_06280 [Prolixibacteraceae bacterium]|nr:hypothetical protein [Prolixibacteraceae bacterium]
MFSTICLMGARRRHKNEFYIYFPDPDLGIYTVNASNPKDRWSNLVLVQVGKALSVLSVTRNKKESEV